MLTVYLDTNIYGAIIKKGLEQKLLDLKNIFIYRFSKAHLSDYLQDKSECKWNDLEFIKKFTENNYLEYNSETDKLQYIDTYPIEAFTELVNDQSLEIFENLDVLINILEQDYPELKPMIDVLNQYFNQPISFNIDSTGFPDEYRNAISKILPIKQENLTLYEYIKKYHNNIKEIFNDETIYREMRESLLKLFEIKHFNVNYESLDFNDQLKDTPIRSTFLEFVDNVYNGMYFSKKGSLFQYYICGYMSLDMLGISKEKTNKVRYPSLINDGNHSVYGAFCDIVVSNDKGFLKKTKLLYNLLNIETKIFTLDEFIQYINDNIVSVDNFNLEERLENDILEGTKDNIFDNDSNIKIHTIDPSIIYFNSFNLIKLIKYPDKDVILLLKRKGNLSGFIPKIDFNNTIKEINKELGIMHSEKYEITDEEIVEINKNVWKGRVWKLSDSILELRFDTVELGLFAKIYQSINVL